MKKRALSKVVSLIMVLCLIAGTLQAVVSATDDLKGKTVILYSANIRGDIDVYSYMVALKNSYSEKGADVIMADLGNYLQGSVYASYDSGKTVVELMDLAGYDVAAIGSHEFDFGTGKVGKDEHEIYYEDDTLGKLLENASFSAVSANILMITEDESLSAFLPNTEITTKSGLKIGFFGITDPETANNVLETNITDLKFADVAEAIDNQVKALADCDITIGLSNTGANFSIKDVAMLDVDSNSGIVVGELIIDNNTKTVVSDNKIDYKSVNQDAKVMTAVEAAKKIVDKEYPTGTVLKSEVTLNGSIKVSRSKETNMGNFWTDALLWFAVEGGIANYYDEDEIAAGNTGIQVDKDNIVAIWNGGNLRDYLNAGDITMKDIQRVLPYPNKVAVAYLSGEQLLELLEAAAQGLPYSAETNSACASFAHVAGIKYTVKTNAAFDAGEAYGKSWFKANSINRVSIESINGKEFDKSGTYAVITSNAAANGMDSNYICLDKDPDLSTITSATVTDVIWLYASKKLGGVIGGQYAEPQGRITVGRSYSDVSPSAWYGEAVEYATANNFIKTMGDSFAPNENMMKAEFIAALNKLAGKETEANATETATDGEITRQQLASYIYDYYGRPEVNGLGKLKFTDISDIDEENIDAVLYCYMKGLMIGVLEDSFAPNDTVSRAMAAAVLYRMK